MPPKFGDKGYPFLLSLHPLIPVSYHEDPYPTISGIQRDKTRLG